MEFPDNEESLRSWVNWQISRIPSSPGFINKPAIVIPTGGKYTVNAYLNIKMLRHLGCTLPIECWYLGRAERHEKLFMLLADLGVDLINAIEFQEEYDIKHNSLNGWELKSFAIKHSKYAHIIMMDSDVMSVKPLEYIFDCPAYKDTGILILRDQYFLSKASPVWEVLQLSPQDVCECESGIVAVDKNKNWDYTWLCCKLSEYGARNYWSFTRSHGDKQMHHQAALLLNKPFSWSVKPMRTNIPHTMSQYDWNDADEPTFYHRVASKFKWTDNEFIKKFPFEQQLHDWLEELITITINPTRDYKFSGDYIRVFDKVEKSKVELKNGEITGAGSLEKWYRIQDGTMTIVGEKAETTAVLDKVNGSWVGKWVVHEKCPCFLI
jgi:hypothetical protein